jgi:hypothetical protein
MQDRQYQVRCRRWLSVCECGVYVTVCRGLSRRWTPRSFA